MAHTDSISPCHNGGTRNRTRVLLFDVPIDALHLQELLQSVLQAIRSQTRLTIFYANAHSLNLARLDRTFAHTLARGDLVYCDGTGVRVAAWLTEQQIPERMTGADWIGALSRLCVREDLSLFLLGGEPGRAEGAARVLRTRHPGISIVGTAPGYNVDDGTLCQVREARPDIILVGMGSPNQERWIVENRDQLDMPVVWAVGALFDFVSGRIRRGARWMTDNGLEWVCRLAAEPRKLWRRYLLGLPQVFAVLIWRYRLSPLLRLQR